MAAKAAEHIPKNGKQNSVKQCHFSPMLSHFSASE
ncbi:MAG: hypothetical protein ACI9CF_001487 [Candidatus Omnitrophota bacterium]|jgi:hypothetical protein